VSKKAGVIFGDGAGPEVIKATLDVLNACNTQIELINCEAGGEQWERNGRKDSSYIPESTMAILENSDACLKGATATDPTPGTPKSVDLTLRQKFDTYANIRPFKTYTKLSEKNFEFVCFREATEGFVGGEEVLLNDETSTLLRRTTKKGCNRIVASAFSWAEKNNLKKIFVITKRNIFKITDGFLWREVEDISKKYPDIEVKEMNIDNVAQQLVIFPEQFDKSVLLGTNLYMDIITGVSAGVIGSVGLSYSANLGEAYGIFEGAHGSVPPFANQDKVNPTAAILSGAWMAEYLGEEHIKRAIFAATEKVINEGKYITFDIGGSAKLSQMKDAIVDLSSKEIRK